MEQLDRATTFFDFHPATFVEEVDGLVSGVVTEGADVLEMAIVKEVEKSKGTLTEKEKSAVAEGVDRYAESLHESTRKNFDRFTAYVVKNIFQIPEEVMDAIDEEEQREFRALLESIDSDPVLKEEIMQLQKEMKEIQGINQGLVQEIEGIDKDLIRFHKEIVPEIDGIRSACEAKSTNLGDVEKELKGLLQEYETLKESVIDTSQAIEEMEETRRRKDTSERHSRHQSQLGNIAQDDLNAIQASETNSKAV